jgi:hypothetical protein
VNVTGFADPLFRKLLPTASAMIVVPIRAIRTIGFVLELHATKEWVVLKVLQPPVFGH